MENVADAERKQYAALQACWESERGPYGSSTTGKAHQLRGVAEVLTPAFEGQKFSPLRLRD